MIRSGQITVIRHKEYNPVRPGMDVVLSVQQGAMNCKQYYATKALYLKPGSGIFHNFIETQHNEPYN
jgi:hypothetical protein